MWQVVWRVLATELGREVADRLLQRIQQALGPGDPPAASARSSSDSTQPASGSGDPYEDECDLDRRCRW